MKVNRRQFLKTSITLSAAGVTLFENSLVDAAWSETDFAPNPFSVTLKNVLGGKPIVESENLTFNIPEIAENGALVPVTVSSTLNDIKSIAILVEQNPVPLAIQAILLPDLEIFMSARLKIASTSFVYAIAEGNKACYSVKKKVKVTIGGCGG